MYVCLFAGKCNKSMPKMQENVNESVVKACRYGGGMLRNKRGWRRMLPTSIDFVNGEIINEMPQI